VVISNVNNCINFVYMKGNRVGVKMEILLGFLDVSVAVSEKSQFHGLFAEAWK